MPRPWFDVNGDEMVDGQDMAHWLSLSDATPGGTDFDGAVETADRTVLVLNWTGARFGWRSERRPRAIGGACSASGACNIRVRATELSTIVTAAPSPLTIDRADA